jgi:hypothetical protein
MVKKRELDIETPVPVFFIGALYNYIAEDREIDHIRAIFHHLACPLALREINDVQARPVQAGSPGQAIQRFDEVEAFHPTVSSFLVFILSPPHNLDAIALAGKCPIS